MEPVVAPELGDRIIRAEADARVIEDFRITEYASSAEARSALDVFLQYFGKSRRQVSASGHWMSYQCTDKSCPFYVSFCRSASDRIWRVSKLRGADHNPCHGTFKPTSRLLANQLRSVEPSLLAGPAKPMQHYVSTELHATVSVRQISRAKQKVLQDIDRWDESFSLIPSYVREFRALNPGGHAAYCVHPDSNVFRGLAVFPDTARVAAASFKRLWALGCSFLRHDWPTGRLMLLVAQDWQDQDVIIGAAVVDSESSDNYTWFLQQARKIPGVAAAMDDQQTQVAFVSDSGLAIQGALPLVAPHAVQRLCSRHLLENLLIHLGRQGLQLDPVMKDGLWSLQQACTQQEYTLLLNTLRVRFPQAVDYLTTTEEPSKWTDWASPIPVFGVRTSNIVEQENAAFQEERVAQAPLFVIDDVLKNLSCRMAENYERARKYPDAGAPGALLPNAAALKRKQLDESANYEVFPVSGARHEFQVRRRGRAVAHDSRQVLISDDLTTYRCTCRLPFHYHIPCRHVFAAANSRNLHDLFIPAFYTVAEHIRLYADMSLRIPDYQPLLPQDEVRPPQRASQKRRHGPQKRLPSHQEIPCAGENARHRAGVQRCCSSCHHPGHNKRSCPNNRAAR